MSDIDRWVSECRAAVAQAERLAGQLRRLGGNDSRRLGDLALRIANLRAAIDALDTMQAVGKASEPVQLLPEWMQMAERSPWCAPEIDG